MLNDFPIGLYLSEEEATRAGEVHKKTRMANADRPNFLFYRVYPFKIGAEAR